MRQHHRRVVGRRKENRAIGDVEVGNAVERGDRRPSQLDSGSDQALGIARGLGKGIELRSKTLTRVAYSLAQGMNGSALEGMCMPREPGAHIGTDRTELEARELGCLSKVGWGAEAYDVTVSCEGTTQHEHRLDIAARTVHDQCNAHPHPPFFSHRAVGAAA